MSRFLYTCLIRLYGLGIRLAALRSRKARDWVAGRKRWRERLEAQVSAPGPDWIWFHCASLGEFEQARNLIDHLYDHHPEFRILVTFFSPSGYNVRHSYPKAHHVAYLPLDTPANARDFLRIVRPRFGMFVKYEIWINLLAACNRQKIPLVLIAARPDPDSPAFRWPVRHLVQNAYTRFRHIFTQDGDSARFFRELGHPSVSVSSDTRFDRVTANKDQWQGFPEIAGWLDGRKCLVAGSTWPRDEELLIQAWLQLPAVSRPCLIMAPHDIHPEKIDQRVRAMEDLAIRYRDMAHIRPRHQILWIDTIGMLSQLYAYGDLAYVGGGFSRALHNILEPAVFGNPIFIGPRYERFPEAVDLIRLGGCMSVSQTGDLAEQIRQVLEQEELRQAKARTNTGYIAERAGATEKILTWLASEGWLS